MLNSTRLVLRAGQTLGKGGEEYGRRRLKCDSEENERSLQCDLEKGKQIKVEKEEDHVDIEDGFDLEDIDEILAKLDKEEEEEEQIVLSATDSSGSELEKEKDSEKIKIDSSSKHLKDDDDKGGSSNSKWAV
jgi:hypothetical protein